MKRHPSLVLLSREHHDGLLLATRLQQGERALLRLWSHDPLWQAEYVVSFFDKDLASHFRAEEELLFPLCIAHAADAREMVARLTREHREMEGLIAGLRTPSAPAEALKRFGKILEGHIRVEERELFPLCEEKIPAEELDLLGRQIAAALKPGE